tara:strand:- start:289 stop:489 length:201 start_codon:yes stop_codon:yes gene_type:complete
MRSIVVCDFLQGQERLEALALEVPYCQAMRIGLKLKKMPLFHVIALTSYRSNLNDTLKKADYNLIF